MSLKSVRWFAIAMALIALNGCGSDTFQSNVQANVGVMQSHSITNEAVNGGVTQGSMKLISDVPVYGRATFDPQGKLTDTSSIIGISEYQGYVAIVWWPNTGNLYISVAKNGKWIITDEPMPLPWSQLNDYYSMIFSGNRLYYVGSGIAYSTIDFQTGNVSAIKRLSVPKEPYHSFYQDWSSDGPVLGYMARGLSSQLNIVRLFDGKSIVFRDQYHSLKAGINTKYFVDYEHHRLILQGESGSTRSINYLTGQIATDTKGRANSPKVEGLLFEYNGTLYNVNYPQNSDRVYQVRKFADTLIPEGIIKLPIQPVYNASEDQTWLTSSSGHIDIWHAYVTSNGIKLQQIAISQ